MTEVPADYLAVINAEEQYSVWRSDLPIPVGWRAVTATCSKQECLDFIAGAWTDMRPKSLRVAMSNGDDKPPPTE